MIPVACGNISIIYGKRDLQIKTIKLYHLTQISSNIIACQS